jgi:branched-chain amino acid transport system ATP-binding protein
MLQLRNVEVVYNDAVQVLRGVYLEVPAGGVVALLGANGAGKTTTLRAVTGLLATCNGEVTRGSITFAGEPIDGLDAATIVRRGVSQVMEGRRVFAELTVDENLAAGAFTRRDRVAIKDAYGRVMDLFPALRNRRRAIAGYLSGGEQQMLAIGRALMQSPRLLLLDEPSLGLAPLLVQQVAETIADIRAQGTSVLLVEQNAVMRTDASSRSYEFPTA